MLSCNRLEETFPAIGPELLRHKQSRPISGTEARAHRAFRDITPHSDEGSSNPAAVQSNLPPFVPVLSFATAAAKLNIRRKRGEGNYPSILYWTLVSQMRSETVMCHICLQEVERITVYLYCIKHRTLLTTSFFPLPDPYGTAFISPVTYNKPVLSYCPTA